MSSGPLTAGVASGATREVRKRLSDGSLKTYNYRIIRKHIELTFNTDSEKLQFEKKCEDIRTTLGCKSLKDVIFPAVMSYNVGAHASASPHSQQPQSGPSAVGHADGAPLCTWMKVIKRRRQLWMPVTRTLLDSVRALQH